MKERLQPINGLLRVPEEPGLGVTLDRDALARLKHLKLPEQEKWILKSTFENGTKQYMIADPADSILLVRPDRARHIPMSYDSPISSEYWDDDGSPEYRTMFARLKREGLVLERA